MRRTPFARPRRRNPSTVSGSCSVKCLQFHRNTFHILVVPSMNSPAAERDIRV